MGNRLQHREAALLARLQNAGRFCRYTHRAEGRNVGRGSNRRWMNVQWQVKSHSTHDQLETFGKLVGLKKSIMKWAETEMRGGRPATDRALQAANTAVNNAIDIH